MRTLSRHHAVAVQVDNTTDAVIQATIRSAFAECTVRAICLSLHRVV